MILMLIQSIEDEFDRNRLESIYIEYYKLFLYKAIKIAKEQTIAEDIIQDAMIRVIKRIHILRDLSEAQLLAYIVKTIQSCAIDYYRKNKGEPVFENLEDHTELEIPCDVMENLDKEALEMKLGEMLKHLPQREQDILVYKYIMDYDDVRISQLLGIKAESVRMALTRARRKVKEFWKEYEHDL